MQYLHLRSQRSVTDSRRYLMRLPNESMKGKDIAWALIVRPLSRRECHADRWHERSAHVSWSCLHSGQQLGDGHQFFARLAEEGTAARLGGVNGCPMGITHDLGNAPAQLRQERIGVTGARRRVRGQISKDSSSRGQATGAIRSDCPARAALAPSTGERPAMTAELRTTRSSILACTPRRLS